MDLTTTLIQNTSRIVGELVVKHDKEVMHYPKPSSLLVDPQVYRMKSNSSIALPSYILLKVWENDENVYCIVQVTEHTRTDIPHVKLYTMELVEHPFELVKKGVLYEDGLPFASQSYAYIRPATDTYVESVMILNMNRSKTYLKMEDQSRMYEYTFAHPATVLGPRFDQIRKGKDTAKKYHFVAGKDRACFPRPLPDRPASKNTIPPHVFRVFVQQAIEKKEECPVSMETLTMDTIASPPCGHLFCYDALARALKDTKKCPACRASATVEEIQYL